MAHRDTSNRGVAGQGHHFVAMAAQQHGLNIFDRAADFLRQERAVASGIQYATLTDNPILGEATDLPGQGSHGVQGVGDDDQNRVRAMGLHGLNTGGGDVGIVAHQLLTGHARRARLARGQDHDIRVRRGGVVAAARDAQVEPFDRTSLKQVKSLTLCNTREDVDQHNVGQLFACDPVGAGRANEPRSDDSNFLAHNGVYCTACFARYSGAMNARARELLQSFLEHEETAELPAPVGRALVRVLSNFGEGRQLLRELALVSLEKARRALALVESELFYADIELLRQEIYLVEDEQEAAMLATEDEATLEAHITLFALLPQEAEPTKRRRRVLALALVESYPERAAIFIGDYKPGFDVPDFWSPLRRRLMQQLKSIAPHHAIALVDLPQDAHYWLLELLSDPEADHLSIALLVVRILEIGPPLALPLPETIRLIDILVQTEVARRIDLLCLMTLSGFRPVDDRPILLGHLIQEGKSLPEPERIRLAEAIRKDGITYLSTADRRDVLRRLAHFSRYAHPEIQRELRILRAIALLPHLKPCRLSRARSWAPAYDKRFQKRVQAVTAERDHLLGRATTLLKALSTRNTNYSLENTPP